MKRIKKDGQLILINDTNSVVSSEIINLFLVLIRYYFSYSNKFYKINLNLTIIIHINSLISILFSILTYSTFEILFKQISIINYSINIYSYLLVCSIIISILFILLTTDALLYIGKVIYFQQQYQRQNQVKIFVFLKINFCFFLLNKKLIRLSKLDDRYIISKSIQRSLLYYLLFVILTITSQLPLIILTMKFFLSGLTDYLLGIYIIFIILFVFFSITLITFIHLYPLSYWNFNYLNKYSSKSNQHDQKDLFQYFYR